MSKSIEILTEGNARRRSRKGLAGLPGVFTLGFILSYLKGFLSTVATVDLPPLIDNMLLFAGLFFLLLYLVGNAHKLGKRLYLSLAILAAMAACYVFSSDSSPFFACLVFFCVASLSDIRPLIRLWFWMTLGLVLFNSLVYGVQLLTGDAEVFYRFDEGALTARYGLGFVHPNMAGAYLFWLCGCGLFCRFGKQGLADIVVVEAVALFTIFVVDSKTSGYLTAALPVMFALQQQWVIFTRNRIIRAALGILPVVLFALTYLLAGPLYNQDLGELFTGRPWLWHVCLDNQGLTIFGQKFEVASAIGTGGFTWDATTLDSFYANGLMVSGLLFSSLFCFAVFRHCKSNGPLLAAEMPFLVLALLFGFTEGHLVDICLGFPLILMLGSDCLSSQKPVEVRGLRTASSRAKVPKEA